MQRIPTSERIQSQNPYDRTFVDNYTTADPRRAANAVFEHKQRDRALAAANTAPQTREHRLGKFIAGTALVVGGAAAAWGIGHFNHSTPHVPKEKTQEELTAEQAHYASNTILSNDSKQPVEYIVHNETVDGHIVPDTAVDIADYFDPAGKHPELINQLQAEMDVKSGARSDHTGVRVAIPRADITNSNAPGYQK